MQTTVETTTIPATRVPLAMPEITTTETDYDRFKARRNSLVDALRSKADSQIKGALRNGNGGVCFVGLGNDILSDCAT